MWYEWLAVIIILAFVEFLTVGLTTIWFVISGIVALLASFVIDDFAIQFAIFVILGIILLLTTRKKLEENYEKWKNLDNSHKNDNMDQVLEIIKEERNDANKENYLYYELFLLKEKINALVKQPNKNKKIEELYKESISLLNEINKLNGYVINEREELTDNKLISMSDNLYQNGFNNYVVFADLNNFNALFAILHCPL